MEVFEDLRAKNDKFDYENDEIMRSCFEHFDSDGDGKLNLKEFEHFTEALFSTAKGEAYPVDKTTLRDLYSMFAKNADEGIDLGDFQKMWTNWIKVILHPVCALIVVDAQNDFISGSLALSNCETRQNGEDVIPAINKLLETVHFDVVAYSLDWHPENHVSFVDNVKHRKVHETSKVTAEEARVFDTVVFENPSGGSLEQKLWPKHCVEDTWGAQLHHDLKVIENALIVKKGSNPDVDSYSAFADNNKQSKTVLKDELLKKNVTDVFVCGLAYDICVAATALDALHNKFRTVVVDDGCRYVSEKDAAAFRHEFESANGVIVNSDQVNDMVDGRDRRPEMGYQLALILQRNHAMTVQQT